MSSADDRPAGPRETSRSRGRSVAGSSRTDGRAGPAGGRTGAAVVRAGPAGGRAGAAVVRGGAVVVRSGPSVARAGPAVVSAIPSSQLAGRRSMGPGPARGDGVVAPPGPDDEARRFPRRPLPRAMRSLGDTPSRSLGPDCTRALGIVFRPRRRAVQPPRRVQHRRGASGGPNAPQRPRRASRPVRGCDWR